MRTERFLLCAFLAESTTLLSPGMSRAMGFSRNTCLPAATQAAKCCGLNTGVEVSRTMSTPLSMTFWKASKPMNSRLPLSVSIRSPYLVLNLGMFARVFSKMSAAAQRMVSGSAVRMSLTAPAPRAPSPTTPTLSFFLELVVLAFTYGKAMGVRPIAAVPRVVFLTKLRRVSCDFAVDVCWSDMMFLGV